MPKERLSNELTNKSAPYFDTDCSWSLDESNNDLIEGELFQGRYDDFSENDEMQLLLFGVRLRNLFENNEYIHYTSFASIKDEALKVHNYIIRLHTVILDANPPYSHYHILYIFPDGNFLRGTSAYVPSSFILLFL
nr:15545_t:CDS:2 [Entrophospora candida]